MRCNQHRKDYLGDCMWCGKKLCEMCIVKQEGKKYYCENCAVSLVPYKKAIVARPKPRLEAAAQSQQETTVKKRFVLGQDGYFELK